MYDEAPCYNALEQESESSNIVFLVPDDVLECLGMLAIRGGGGGGCMQKRLNVLRFKAWGFLHDCSCIICIY